MSAEQRRLPRQVVESIGSALAAGSMRAGDVLGIAELEQRFGISRTVARDAVRVLEAKGMLSTRQRVGLIARPLSEWNLFDPDVIRWRLIGADHAAQLEQLSELRVAVEPLAAALAAERASEAQRERLLTLAAEMRAKAQFGDQAGFVEADIAFHHLLLAASGNSMFQQLGAVTEQVLRGRGDLDLMPAAPDPDDALRHVAVADAITSGDVEGAERAMREIMRESRRDIRRFLAERS